MKGRASQKYRVCAGYLFPVRWASFSSQKTDTDMPTRAAVRKSMNASASEQVGWKRGGGYCVK